MKQLKYMLYFLSISLTLFLFNACSYDNEEELFEGDCGLIENVSLQQDIVPLFDSNCFSCHSTENASGGVVLETYLSLKEVAENGRLLGAIKHQEGFTNMPLSGEMLNECMIKTIEVWIEEGIQNN